MHNSRRILAVALLGLVTLAVFAALTLSTGPGLSQDRSRESDNDRQPTGAAESRQLSKLEDPDARPEIRDYRD